MVLENLLRVIEEATAIAPRAFQTDKVGEPSIVYSFYRASDNGAVAQYRLQLRVFGRTMSEAAELEQKASKALITVGDETSFGCSIESNGGGSMIDAETNTPQLITYFDVVSRS